MFASCYRKKPAKTGGTGNCAHEVAQSPSLVSQLLLWGPLRGELGTGEGMDLSALFSEIQYS